MDLRIDEIDKRILYHLAADARNVSAPMIADELDVTPGTIRNRIGQLENEGVITGYHAQIDYERVEGRIVNLFICTAAVTERERIATRALDISGVVNVRELMAGQRNIHVTGVGTSTDDITRIAGELSELGLEIEEESIVQQESSRPYEPFGPEDSTQRSSMADFVSLTGGAEVMEVTVSDSAAIAGESLSEADAAGLLPDDLLVVGIERDDEIVTPKGDTTIEAGDVVTVVSPQAEADSLVDVFSTRAESVE